MVKHVRYSISHVTITHKIPISISHVLTSHMNSHQYLSYDNIPLKLLPHIRMNLDIRLAVWNYSFMLPSFKVIIHPVKSINVNMQRIKVTSCNIAAWGECSDKSHGHWSVNNYHIIVLVMLEKVGSTTLS